MANAIYSKHYIYIALISLRHSETKIIKIGYSKKPKVRIKSFSSILNGLHSKPLVIQHLEDKKSALLFEKILIKLFKGNEFYSDSREFFYLNNDTLKILNNFGVSNEMV